MMKCFLGGLTDIIRPERMFCNPVWTLCSHFYSILNTTGKHVVDWTLQ